MHGLHLHMRVHMYVCTHARMHPCTNAGVHSGTLHATCQVPVARYAMQPGWMTGVAWSPVGEALLASTDAPAIVLQLLQAPRTPHRTPHAAASFDVLEAGDMVEGCSIWVSVRLGSNRCRLGCFLICRLLLRRLRFRFCVCGFDPVRNFCGWLLFSAPSLPRLCSARRLVSCRLCQLRHESSRMLCDVLVRGGPSMVLLLLLLSLPIFGCVCPHCFGALPSCTWI